MLHAQQGRRAEAYRRRPAQVRSTVNSRDVKEIVREKYGQAALRAKTGAGNACCGGASADDACCDPITSNLYDTTQGREVPDLALKASLGCGNPTALAALAPGQVVL